MTNIKMMNIKRMKIEMQPHRCFKPGTAPVLILSGMAMLMSCSCRRKEVSQLEIEADRLYHRSVELTKTYTDSMAKAKDSATVLRLDHSLDDKLTKLNYEYRAETYLEISQGQNDTLTNITLRFASLRDSLLNRFAHPLPSPNDSIPTDSLP